MKLFYNILFLIFFIVSSPWYLWRLIRRGNWKKGFAQRFGFYSSSLTNKIRPQTIWFHAVSVGEVNICAELIKQFSVQFPQFQIIASTTTTTGMAEIQKKLPQEVIAIYYPIDFPFCVQRVLNLFKPQAIILIEAEIWPNFLWCAAQKNIPLYLFNARLSQKSFRRYSKAKFIFRGIFSSFHGIGVQNEIDREHLISLGAKPENISITGNLKFDGVRLKLDNHLNVSQLLSQIGVSADSPILVAGSTHSGEEILLAQIALRIKRIFPNFFLIIVPRHFERTKIIVQELQKTDIRFTLRTEITDQTHTSPGTYDCLIVNTTGELRFFYEAATITFIGKSLTAKGGQNPIEPAVLEKPILFGPNMQNFRSIVHSFLSADAAIQITDSEDLEKNIIYLLKTPERCKSLGTNARQVVLKNQGATERSIAILKKNTLFQQT